MRSSPWEVEPNGRVRSSASKLTSSASFVPPTSMTFVAEIKDARSYKIISCIAQQKPIGSELGEDVLVDTAGVEVENPSHSTWPLSSSPATGPRSQLLYKMQALFEGK